MQAMEKDFLDKSESHKSSPQTKSSNAYSVEARRPASSIVTRAVAATSVASITTAVAQPVEAATSIAIATAQASKASVAVAQAFAGGAVVTHGIKMVFDLLLQICFVTGTTQEHLYNTCWWVWKATPLNITQ